MSHKKKKKKTAIRAEEPKAAAEPDTTEDSVIDGFNDEELKDVEPLTEADIQKRMAQLFEITRLEGKYRLTESGTEMLAAQLKLIDDYISLARIKADLAEAQIYLRAEELRNL